MKTRMEILRDNRERASSYPVRTRLPVEHIRNIVVQTRPNIPETKGT